MFYWIMLQIQILNYLSLITVLVTQSFRKHIFKLQAYCCAIFFNTNKGYWLQAKTTFFSNDQVLVGNLLKLLFLFELEGHSIVA